MTVESTARKESFTLDGVTTEFSFTFRALVASPTDIKCAVLTGSTTTLLVYNTNYVATINADGVGGKVTLISAASIGLGTLTVYRETTLKQESDYTDYNSFPADTLEEDLDRAMASIQELNEAVARTLKLSITTSVSDLDVPEPESNKVLGWNTSGDGLENKSLVDLDALEKATTTDAETGTDDTKFMTPAKVKSEVEKAGAVTIPVANIVSSTDGTLTLNSNSIIPTQKAVKTYADTKIGIPSSSAQGDIIYHNGTSHVRLPAGENGQYLKTQGSGANPTWSTIALNSIGDAVDKTTSYGAQQASTDGFVIANVYGTGTISVYTDANADPTTKIGGITGSNSGSVTVPVKKGNYWKVVLDSGSIGSVYWIPLGS